MILYNKLLPHQVDAVNKMIRLKVGALFMEQGTGKTITTLEIARIRYEAKKIDTVLWLCPCSAKKNIKQEIRKHCPADLYQIIMICGIETLSTSIRANSFLMDLVSRRSVFLVIDESLLVKNPKAYRTQNILNIAKSCSYRIILNGTPISRNEADLFSQFYLLDWRILGYRSYWSFAANHLEYDEYGKLQKVLNTEYLAHKIEPYTFQISKKDCMKIPRKFYTREGFYLTQEQEHLYDYVANYLLSQIDEHKPETIYRLFSALQAVISGKNVLFKNRNHFETEEFFTDPLDNPRIRKTLSLLPDEKTIIFCKYQSEISQLCNILPDAVRFDGKIPYKKRIDALEQFKGPKKYLVANKNCAGFSLNLQFCHNIIYMSNDWDMAKRQQSEDRVHRFGQENMIDICDVYAYQTIDENILECLIRKENLLDKIKEDIRHASLKETLKRMIHGNQHSELEDPQ